MLVQRLHIATTHSPLTAHWRWRNFIALACTCSGYHWNRVQKRQFLVGMASSSNKTDLCISNQSSHVNIRSEVKKRGRNPRERLGWRKGSGLRRDYVSDQIKKDEASLHHQRQAKQESRLPSPSHPKVVPDTFSSSHLSRSLGFNLFFINNHVNSSRHQGGHCTPGPIAGMTRSQIFHLFSSYSPLMCLSCGMYPDDIWLTEHSTGNYWGRANNLPHTTLENMRSGGREIPFGRIKIWKMRRQSRNYCRRATGSCKLWRCVCWARGTTCWRLHLGWLSGPWVGRVEVGWLLNPIYQALKWPGTIQ